MFLRRLSMKVIKDFKEFAVRGNVIDLGIGVMIGTAFGKIVESLVSDIIMPPIGLVLGRVDFSNLYINLSGSHFLSLQEAKDAGAATVNYGIFINNIFHFVIISFTAFMVVKQMNKMRKLPAEAMTVKECPFCFSSIPTRAIKCPQCTMDIEKNENKNKEERGPKLTIRAS
jgi:large conductance mechanosensitive channel